MNKVALPSGLRRWFKAPVSSGAWVRIPLRTPFCPRAASARGVCFWGIRLTCESAIGLVVKYLVANEVPRVRFPDGAYLAPVAQLVAPRSYVPMVQGSSPCRSILVHVPFYPLVKPPQDWANPGSIRKCTQLASYVHTMVKAPDPFRTLKLSTIGPAQYCGGGPRGNRR